MNTITNAGTVAVSEVYRDLLVTPGTALPIMVRYYPNAIEYVVTPASKSSWGSLADLGPAPSAEDIDEMRREIWGSFSREDS